LTEDARLPLNTYPANEQRISEVERGQSCRAIVPVCPDKPLAAGDTVLFALSNSRAGQQPYYVKGGDSVLVCLTGVTDLGRTDPATGQALVELTWKPLGPIGSLESTPKRPAKCF
jgi:hypothetical protein